MYFALHLISSSSDHYNMLVYADTPAQLVGLVKANCSDFDCIEEVYLDSEVRDENERYHEALLEGIKNEREG